MVSNRTFGADSENAQPRRQGRGFSVTATGGRHSATYSGGTTLIAKHVAIVSLCIMAVVVPAIPGIESLAPGEERSVRTDAGSDSFLSAPSCSEARADLCLSFDGDQASGSSALREIEQSALLGAALPEADTSARARGPQTTTTPEPWGTMAIRPGDTLIALANWFGLTPFELAVINGAAVDDYLVIGQTLVIPLPESEVVVPPMPDVSEPAAAPVAVAPVPAREPPPPVVLAPPAPTAPPASSGPWTRDEVVEAICSLPWPCERMVAIASCESGLRADALNPAGYYGLFQINHWFNGWDNPWTNAQAAYYEKYLPSIQAGGDGLSSWPVCRYY